MESGDRPEPEHDVPLCDTERHIIPDEGSGLEDPGCHRIVQYGPQWGMLFRDARGRLMYSDERRIVPAEDALRWFELGARELAFLIPRQRTA